MSANCKATAHDGVVYVDTTFHSCNIIGSSCPTTLRPEMGEVKGSFKIFPIKSADGKESEDITLVATHYCDTTDYSFFHMKQRSDGYVRVCENPTDAKDLAGANANFQIVDATGVLELQTDGIRFTTDAKALSTEEEPVMFTDANSILKFVVGRIKLTQLKAAAKKAQKAIHIRTELKQARIVRDAAQVELRQKDRELAVANRELTGLRSQLAELSRPGY